MSIVLASLMPFLLVGGSIAEFIGRKPTLIIGQSIIILGWISVYFANSFPLLLFGRLVGGIGCGLNLPVTTLLLSEIALINMRGILSMMSLLGIVSIVTIFVHKHFKQKFHQ